MGDMYAVDLALDLAPTVPAAVLDELRFHLGAPDAPSGADQGDGGGESEGDLTALLAGRGPARRIGGVRTGELVRARDGWALTARQELHAELLPELHALVERLALHARTEGVIGQIRFYEEWVPELLINRSGTPVRMPLGPRG
ncbi:hypothetical protein [Streptomyces abyssomicinicus]|uniref:hypothetical protein n=1 Tax=Streptomyces abyssomicinicus TaxID=574929 RepID=UPI001250B14D|nr:hypothetical protein [Streptomyces abyssomicinicus]